MILDGKALAQKTYSQLKKEISESQHTPCLGAVLVGNNSSSQRYIAQKRKFAEQIWMNFSLLHFPETLSENELLEHIQSLNNNSEISWYIVQLPLPAHINSTKIIESIAPEKDVDGFHPINQGKLMIGDENGLIPCTPKWVMEIFKEYNISVIWKKVVILGRSNIVGKPLALLCINAGATVISCNSHTPDVSLHTRTADIIICATGQPHILSADMISKNAVIIDVGFSVVDGKILGDAYFEEILAQWNDITPVPGWVGPMTVAMLLSQTYTAYKNNIWNPNT